MALEPARREEHAAIRSYGAQCVMHLLIGAFVQSIVMIGVDDFVFDPDLNCSTPGDGTNAAGSFGVTTVLMLGSALITMLLVLLFLSSGPGNTSHLDSVVLSLSKPRFMYEDEYEPRLQESLAVDCYSQLQ